MSLFSTKFCWDTFGEDNTADVAVASDEVEEILAEQTFCNGIIGSVDIFGGVIVDRLGIIGCLFTDKFDAIVDIVGDKIGDIIGGLVAKSVIVSISNRETCKYIYI